MNLYDDDDDDDGDNGDDVDEWGADNSIEFLVKIL